MRVPRYSRELFTWIARSCKSAAAESGPPRLTTRLHDRGLRAPSWLRDASVSSEMNRTLPNTMPRSERYTKLSLANRNGGERRGACNLPRRTEPTATLSDGNRDHSVSCVEGRLGEPFFADFPAEHSLGFFYALPSVPDGQLLYTFLAFLALKNGIMHLTKPTGLVGNWLWRLTGSSGVIVVRIKVNQRISPELRENPVMGWIRNWLHAVVAPLNLCLCDSVPIAMCASERVAKTSAVSRCRVGILSPFGRAGSSQTPFAA